MYNPDVVWQGDLTSTGTHDIAVTQKPRYITWGSTQSSSSTHFGGLLIADCTKEKLKVLWYGSGGYVEDVTIAFANRIPTCTSSQVTVKGNGSYTTTNHVAIYY